MEEKKLRLTMIQCTSAIIDSLEIATQWIAPKATEADGYYITDAFNDVRTELAKICKEIANI